MLYVRVLCGTVDQGREEFANQLVHFAFFGGGRNIILVFVQICALIFAIKITKAIRKRRTDMTLDMKKIAERKLSELLVEMVNGDNIIKCRPVQIALCRSIFQQILIACNEREITIAVQNCRRIRFIGDNEVFIFELLDLLCIRQKWFRHTNTSKIKRGVPAGTPPITGPTSFCDLITKMSIAENLRFVNNNRK